jgi:hypothetical protein
MDVSKLPKLSNTQEQVRQEQAAATDAPQPPAPVLPRADSKVVPYQSGHEPVTAGVGAEVWLSIILGLIFILIGKNFAAYSFAKLTGRTYHTGVNWVAGPNAGQEVAYPDLQGFVMLNDSAMLLFGLTLLLEAAVMAAMATRFAYKRALVTAALVLAVAATAFNLYAVVRLFSANVMPLISLLAAGFGGYIAAYQWRLLQSLPQSSGASAPDQEGA